MPPTPGSLFMPAPARIGPGASRVGRQAVSVCRGRPRELAPDRRAGHKLEEWRRRVRGMAWLGSGARARLERESGLVGGSKIWARDFRRERAAVRGTGGADTGGGTACVSQLAGDNHKASLTRKVCVLVPQKKK